MEPMTIREIMEAVGGSLLGEFGDLNRAVSRVETDSRTIHPGSLFIPLVGERFDGHAYINAALEGGAAGCFTQRERDSYLPGKFYIKVKSTHRALRDLAKYYKQKFAIPVVAITGSVGKTTTKDMVAAVLGEKYNVLKTEGNLNNDIGVPMTLLRLKPEHQIAVLELGMNHAGEIDYLSAIVEPDMILMTNIGDSHIENLGSRENILKAKCEIFSHMDPEKGFVGSPYVPDTSKRTRTTIYPAKLAEYSNSYCNGDVVCEDFRGASITDLQREVLAGNCVVAYMTLWWESPYYRYYNIEGTTQRLVSNNHAVLVCGYDPEKGYFISDPYNYYNRGQVHQYWENAQTFERIWNERKTGMVLR